MDPSYGSGWFLVNIRILYVNLGISACKLFGGGMILSFLRVHCFCLMALWQSVQPQTISCDSAKCLLCIGDPRIFWMESPTVGQADPGWGPSCSREAAAPDRGWLPFPTCFMSEFIQLLSRKVPWRRAWQTPTPPTSILAWRIPWTEEPGGGATVHKAHRVGHYWNNLAGAHPAAVRSLPPAWTSMNSCDLTYYNLLTDFPTVGHVFCYYERLAPHFHQYLVMLVLILAILPGGKG